MRRSAALVRAGLPPYPRGPRSGPGFAVPVHPHLFLPIRPLAGTSRLRRLATYTRCPRCAYSHMPSFSADGKLIGSEGVVRRLMAGEDPRSIQQSLAEQVDGFVKKRAPYLLYR